MNKEDMECKVIASLMIMLDDKFSNEAKIKAMKDVKKIFEKQQKEIENLNELIDEIKGVVFNTSNTCEECWKDLVHLLRGLKDE